MNCHHNFQDSRLTKYGATNQRSMKCNACEEVEQLKVQLAALQEQVKNLTASMAHLKMKFEWSKPLILR